MQFLRTTGMLASGVLISLGAHHAWSQQKSEVPGNAAVNPISGAVEREVKGLTAEDFPERQAAIKRLEILVAEQIKQRAAIQEVIAALQKDLTRQEQALAMVTDEEAQSQISGLLELERGLAGWTIQTMGEPIERRKALLAWGLSKEAAPVIGRVYSGNKRIRTEGIKQLVKLEDAEDDGAGWTLGKLINDGDGAVRAAAMAAAWARAPSRDVVTALWFRAVTGPMTLAEQNAIPMGLEGERNFVRVHFPEGEPMEFPLEDDAGSYGDALIAAQVLVHLKSSLVEEHIKALVAERKKAGKNLTVHDDPDWTLATHWLVETYNVKEAVPLLAEEALSRESENMNGDANGHPYTWSQRTMGVGVLCKLIGQDATDFGLFRVNNQDLRGWTWATDVSQGPGGMLMEDGAVVRAFYKWWKIHHAEHGVKEEPSDAGVPEPRPGRGRGRGNRGGPAIDVAPQMAPDAVEPTPEAPAAAPEERLDIHPLPARGRAAG